MKEIKYDEKSRCPKCGGILALNLFKKGFRIKCTECRFKIYPPPEQISEELKQGFLQQWNAEKIQPMRSAIESYIQRKRGQASDASGKND